MRDNQTFITDPQFTLNGGSYLQTGGAARLLDQNGQVIGQAAVTPADVAAGRVNVPAAQLDDGTYTFTTQVLNAAGQVVASAPVTVTILTDRDGVAPSTELAANGGDINHDGVLDWQQNNVAQLPLTSVNDFNAGRNAPASSFGAVIAGNINPSNPGAPVVLDAGAQLLDIALKSLPATPLPNGLTPVSPLMQFSVTAQTGSQLTDVDPARAGLQTRVVIDLQPGGVAANAYVKFNPVTQTWVNMTNAASLNGGGDGAALLDTNGDGRIDRVVITLTDGGPGDEDGLVNGTIVDPGVLATLPTVVRVVAEDAANRGANPTDSIIVEGQTLRYTVTLSSAGTTALEYSVGIASTLEDADVSAITLSDGVTYNPATGRITVPAGVTSFGISVSTQDDAQIEQTETLTLTIGGVSATGTVMDNDAQAVRTITANQVPEGSNLVYVVALSGSSPVATEYAIGASGSLETSDVAGVLFSNGVTLHPTSGRLVVPAGVSQFTITLPAVVDALVEGTELLAVSLGGLSATGAVFDTTLPPAPPPAPAPVPSPVPAPAPSPASLLPVYGVGQGAGDRWLSGVREDAESRVQGNGGTIKIDFYATTEQSVDTLPLKAWVNTLTGDYFYAPEGTALPYACYEPMAATGLGSVLAVGKGAFDVHMYMNGQGVTQLVGVVQATQMNLAGQGYADLGALFASSAMV